MDSKKVLNQAANTSNPYDPNFYHKKTMQFQGNATTRLLNREKFESSAIFGGRGTRVNEFFDVSMIQKDESGSIKTISAPGSGQSHSFATMDDFSGIWGIHSQWQKICQKDIIYGIIRCSWATSPCKRICGSSARLLCPDQKPFCTQKGLAKKSCFCSSLLWTRYHQRR